jgi:hypothetical protein
MSSDRDREQAPKVFASGPWQWQGNIFETDVDRQDFVRTLAEADAKTGFEIQSGPVGTPGWEMGWASRGGIETRKR